MHILGFLCPRKKYVNARLALALCFLSHACAAVAVSASTPASGAPLTYDPWTWVVGALGAAIVYIKKDVTTRLDAITNSIISIALAGIVAPELTTYMAARFEVTISPYPLAFLLSASWPWILPILSSLLKFGSK